MSTDIAAEFIFEERNLSKEDFDYEIFFDHCFDLRLKVSSNYFTDDELEKYNKKNSFLNLISRNDTGYVSFKPPIYPYTMIFDQFLTYFEEEVRAFAKSIKVTEKVMNGVLMNNPDARTLTIDDIDQKLGDIIDMYSQIVEIDEFNPAGPMIRKKTMGIIFDAENAESFLMLDFKWEGLEKLSNNQPFTKNDVEFFLSDGIEKRMNSINNYKLSLFPEAEAYFYERMNEYLPRFKEEYAKYRLEILFDQEKKRKST